MERLKGFYAALPPGLRAAIPARLEVWLRERGLPALEGTRAVRRLEARLWGGFSETARPALAAILADPAAPAREAAGAALALARWHGARGDFAAALAAAVAARTRLPARGRDRDQYLLEALFLTRLGRIAEARALLAARRGRRFDPSLPWLLANLRNPALTGRAEDAGPMLALMNGAWRRFGVSAVAFRDPGRPPALGNLRGTAGPGGVEGPAVSVIVPVHDAAATLGTALEGLAGQTWRNLEILVVDDASRDGGAEVAAVFAARDPRFRLIRLPENRGGYAARNRALPEATGRFVTVHDADDWSHPEKIARQVADLVRRDAPANLTDWVRADDALLFPGPWLPSPNQPLTNFSSLLLRRELFDRVGPWDTARVSADREFVARLERVLGSRVPVLLAGCPFALGRSATGSLTRAGATHAASFHHGVRREYREAAELWHLDLDPARLPTAEPPFFPAPAAIASDRRAAAAPRDLLFIGDFNLLGGTVQSARHMMRAAAAAGLSSALLHYRRHDLDPTKPLDLDLRRFAREHEVRIVAPGEALAARTVVVTYPPVFAAAMDRFPEVAHEALVVVVNQMAERDLARRHVAYDPAAVRGNLVRLLGSEGLWTPISHRVRTLMRADPRYPAPSPDTWTPLIDTDAWCAREPVWRGGSGARPVIGRHGRDHPLKWPADPAALAAAYCAGRPCEVRFLGGAVAARARLPRRPRNWREWPFGAVDVQAFLAGLDFFVHYPDPGYIEEFGRAPMEAMAAGVPVILPPEFEPTFGGAALYAAPDAVWPLVERLWRDRAAWEARAAAGRAFVGAECGYDAFPRRLARLPEAAPRAALGG